MVLYNRGQSRIVHIVKHHEKKNVEISGINNEKYWQFGVHLSLSSDKWELNGTVVVN